MASKDIPNVTANKATGTKAAKAEDTLKQVQKINQSNATNSDPNLSSKHAQVNPNLSSNAGNYKKPLHAQVNPRTGELQLAITPPPLSGFLGSNITPSICYRQNDVETNNHKLGLPLGWSYPFSFIKDNRVFINAEQAFVMDESYPSGMRYYTLNNVSLKSYDKGEDLPYNYYANNKKVKYFKALHFHTGENQYFDQKGCLLGIDDRFGNHVLFYYDKADVTIDNCRLTKIIDAYGQEITFAYSAEGITVTYPTGGHNKLQFKYLTDKNRIRLIGYRDPMGQVVKFTNKGGVVRNDLVSDISYPNGLNVHYDYTPVKYFFDTKHDFSRLDFVSAVQEEYAGQRRVVTYHYDPKGDEHNYTGYLTGDSKFALTQDQDALLQSNDHDYRYVTQVDDGVFVTEHWYNNLHLELETKIFSKDKAGKPQLLKHVVNTYQGESGKQQFPPYNKLCCEYQTPSAVVTTVYDEKQQKRTYKVESKLDAYGNLTHMKSYQSTTKDSPLDLKLKSEETIMYDYNEADHNHNKATYGQVLQIETIDYQLDTQKINSSDSQPIIRRTSNTLTKDSKNIGQTTEGFVANDKKTDKKTFEPNKTLSYQYDAKGRVISTKLAWADQKKQEKHDLESTQASVMYAYLNHILTITVTNAKGKKNTVEIDTTTGWTISQTNPLGHGVHYTYDNLGRLLTQTDPLKVTTKWTYEESSNKVTTHYANGYQVYTYYNGFGDLIKHADNMGSAGKERVLTIQTYNDKGQCIAQEGILGEKSRLVYQYNTRGELATATDALGNTTRYEYDAVAQLQKTLYNGILVNEVAYHDEHNTTKTVAYSTSDPKQKTEASTQYDAYGNVIHSLLGNPTSQQNWREAHSKYDSAMNLIEYSTKGGDKIQGKRSITRDLFANPIRNEVSVTLPNATPVHTKSDLLTYNDLNQLVQEKNALNQCYAYTYDDAGNLATYIDYAGNHFTYTYNANNQLITETYQDKAQKTKQEKKLVYDPSTHQIKSVEDFSNGKSQGQLQYTYTLDGKLATMTYPDKKQIKLVYDETKGQLTQFTDALGQSTTYSYDDYGRLIAAKIKDTTHALTISYYTRQEAAAQSGQIKSIQTSNGVQHTYQYNGFGAMQECTTTDTNLPAPANILLQVSYTYDEATRNISTIHYNSTLSPKVGHLNYTLAYNYNSLNQLTTETRKDLAGKTISTTHYTYDAANNPLQEVVTDAAGKKATTIYQYDADNKLVQMTTPAGKECTLKYDQQGNLIDDGEEHSFTYDAKNRLVTYKDTKQNLTATYTYYPNGLRSSKHIAGSEPIHFYYDASEVPNIINEVQGTTSTHYLMLASKRYLRLVQGKSKTEAQYYLPNYKDTLAMVDQAGKLTATYAYDPYGQQQDAAQKTASTAAKDITYNPFQYTHEYTDAESGLLYLRTRYYQPMLKRFISRDKALLMNRYNYVDSNPVMFTDPTGACTGACEIVSSVISEAIMGAIIGLFVGSGIGLEVEKGIVFGAIAFVIRQLLSKDKPEDQNANNGVVNQQENNYMLSNKEVAILFLETVHSNYNLYFNTPDKRGSTVMAQIVHTSILLNHLNKFRKERSQLGLLGKVDMIQIVVVVLGSIYLEEAGTEKESSKLSFDTYTTSANRTAAFTISAIMITSYGGYSFIRYKVMKKSLQLVRRASTSIVGVVRRASTSIVGVVRRGEH